MSHLPIIAPANRPLLDSPSTLDVPIVCGSCLETLAPDGSCLNIGGCADAAHVATRDARRRTIKAPMAVTIMGRVD